MDDHATLMALDLPELRRQMAAHKAARPVDPFAPGMASWMADKDALAFALECKEGEARTPPFVITVPPQPFEDLRVQPSLNFNRMTPLRRHASPESEPPEAPMPTPLPADPDPKGRLAQMLVRLQRNEATHNGAAAYTTRSDIRKFCAAHGLEVPEVARKRPPTSPTAASRPHLPKVQAVEHPEGDPKLQAAQRALLPTSDAMARPFERLTDLYSGYTPAARIRALRSQALDILPDLEDLTPDQARDVRRELGLLSETLVLGSHLSERSA